jgi:hypothetical protein
MVIGPTSTVFIEFVFYGVNYIIYYPQDSLDEGVYPRPERPFDGSDPRLLTANSPEEIERFIRGRYCIDPSCFPDYLSVRPEAIPEKINQPLLRR